MGNITSTAIGVYIIIRVLKFTIDTIIHGQILYDIYGFSWHLIASFWDSLTNFLSHKNIRKETLNIKRDENNGCSNENQDPQNDQNTTEVTDLSDYRGRIYPKFDSAA